MCPKTESEPLQMPLHGQNTRQRHFFSSAFVCSMSITGELLGRPVGGFSNSSGSTAQSVLKC